MNIPTLFLGNRKNVVARARALAKDLIGGKSLEDLEMGAFIDTQSVPSALIVLGGTKALDNGPPHFHVDAFFSEVLEAQSRKRLSESVLQACFAWSLTQPWRFLGVAGQSGGLFLFSKARKVWRRPFLEAALLHLDTLEDEGMRYGHRPTFARRFSQSATSILPVLAELGMGLRPELKQLNVTKLRSMIEMTLSKMDALTS